jgi:DNA adenine methylase
LPLLPAHRQYCELFFGGGSVFFAKAPCEHETINDAEEGVAHFFRVLRDRSDEFITRCQLTEYGEGLYRDCRATWRDEPDELLRAWKWFVVARQSFSGSFGGSHSHTRTHVGRGRPCNVNNWLMAVERLPEVVERLRNTQILCGDWWRAVCVTDTPDCCHYLDPPYVPQTRVGGENGHPPEGYRHELTLQDHEQLVERLLHEVRGRVVLSGYAHPVYLPLEEAGWRRLDWETACYAAGKTRGTGILGEGAAKRMQRRVESVWLDPLTAAEVMPKQGVLIDG